MARATKARRVGLTDEAKARLAEAPHQTLVSPFKRLGLQGLEGIAPILVAALATEESLLLISPHGTAKSLLPTRVAAAPRSEFQHYNASLLRFDDLLGFPMPGKDGRLEYIKTPAAMWSAGAVIFDEISRCRPEIQNKLFSIIHERKVQGIALDVHAGGMTVATVLVIEDEGPLRSGARDVFLKSFSSQKLGEAVQEALQA